jgi:hypothetical protein
VIYRYKTRFMIKYNKVMLYTWKRKMSESLTEQGVWRMETDEELGEL